MSSDLTEQKSQKLGTPLRKSDRTRERLLVAARTEFAEKGLEGARVEAIAARAGVNKQLVYRYFGDKESLYSRVLEDAYARIRAGDENLAPDGMAPDAALRDLVEQIFDRAARMRDVAALLADENVHQGRHAASSTIVRELHAKLVERVSALLRAGEEAGVFRPGIDPVRLFISILGLSSIFMTNLHTLSAAFGRDLTSASEIAEWRRHIVDLVSHGLRAPDDAARSNSESA